MCEFVLNKPLEGSEKQLINNALSYGYSFYEVGGINMEEAVNRETFKNALKYFEVMGYLQRSEKGYTLSENKKADLKELRSRLVKLIKL